MIYSLLKESDFQLRRIGIALLSKYDFDPKNIRKTEIISLLNDSDYEIQAEALKLINMANIYVDPNLILKKLSHPNKKIKSAAALLFSQLDDIENKKEFKIIVKNFIKMLKNPDQGIKSAIMDALANIGNFNKNKIPYEPFLEGISSHFLQ